ncbi:hypothetical protein Tco_1300639 [Tanacetum coccineum]
MSSGSQTTSDAVISKFDIHVYTFFPTFDEVNNLFAEYVIPLDLHPCVPPSGQTMNRLPVDKIGEENMRKMVMMKKIDGLNNEEGKKKWQSMVLEMKIEEIVCSKKEVPARV